MELGHMELSQVRYHIGMAAPHSGHNDEQTGIVTDRKSLSFFIVGQVMHE